MTPSPTASPKGRSIRASLEADAQQRYPGLVQRLRKIKTRVSLPDRPPRRTLCWQDRTLLILGITLMLMLLARMETARADDWGLELAAGQDRFVQLALDTEITAEVTGLLTRIAVTQRFRNDSANWAEGVYRFPLPAGAAVDRLLVRVGDRIIEGEIQEKQVARRIYQQARESGRTASLVEQQRPNQFESRLANIGPGEEIEVTIGFLQNVAYRDGMYSLRIPMTFTPRFETGNPGQLTGLESAPAPTLAPAAARLDHGLQLDVLLYSSIGLATIESRYHDVDIMPQADGYRVVLLNPDERTDRDFELAWAPDLQATPQVTAITWDGGDAVYAQVMLAPPVFDSVSPLPREVVFVIDTSGSMEGASMEQAREALLQGLEQLGPDDRFTVIQFNSITDSPFPRTVPSDPMNLRMAAEYIAGLNAGGGTNMSPALQAALSLDEFPGLIRQVVFITDGSIGNEGELLLYIGEQLGSARLFTVSIGSAPNSGFMRKAAEIGRGSHTHIGRIEEVGERMTALWSHIQVPALTDICVDWGQDADFYPAIVPDLYAGEPLWLTARMPLTPDRIELCGQFDGHDWSQTVRIQASAGSENLATIWARSRLAFLRDEMMFGADPETMKQEITQLGIEYGLLTPHTSLVAVDRTPVRPAGEDLARSDIPGLLPAGSASSTGFPHTATGWRAQMLGALLLLLVAAGLMWLSGARRPMTFLTSAR